MKNTSSSYFKFPKLFIFIVAFIFIATLFISLNKKSQFQAQALPTKPKIFKKIVNRNNKRVCDFPKKGTAGCNAHYVVDDNAQPLTGGVPISGSFGPNEFHLGYNLPCTPGGLVQAVCAQPQSFSNQIIAIVDAYHMPTIENDLGVYSQYYGLPSCTKANGCLRIVNQNGGTTLPTTVNSSWALETALDVEVAHSICQTCKILLVEADSNSLTDLGTAVNTAAALGATSISNSYGTSDWSGDIYYDSYYNHPGIAVTVSSGDSGYGAQYPAASPNVVAVGGTTLSLLADNSYGSESVWSGSGSGCSGYEQGNIWQTSMPTVCGTKRAIADVAADADPNTGAAVYSSTAYQGYTGWWQVGGTSLSAPIIAAVYGLAGGVPANINAASIPYNYFSALNSHDVTTGSNGSCLTNMCNAGTGYDGPTGLGTPNGILGFTVTASVSGTPTPTGSLPTPTSTPSATPTSAPVPTSTPTPTFTPTPVPPDTIKPTVSITYPASGSTVARRTYIKVTANAFDNMGVTKVVFYRNNSLICTVPGPSVSNTYGCSMYTGSVRNKVTYKATAYDDSGNYATSSVSVTVR